MSEENLWGDLPLDVKLETPIAILKSQAAALNKLTKGLLDGQVSSSKTTGGRLSHRLKIVAPALGNYSADLVTVTHDITLYPSLISNVVEGSSSEASNEARLKEILKSILQSESVRRIIVALIAQSTVETENPATA